MPARALPPLLLLVAALFALGGGATRGAHAAPESPGAPLLKDGVPLRASFAPGRARWEARVQVPSDAVALGVVAAGDTDVNLALRHLRPVEGPETVEVASRTTGPAEVVTLTPFSAVPLRGGVWHVLVDAPAALGRAVTFDVIAFVDRASGIHTVLPGRAVSVSLPGEGGRVAFRTFLPRDAINFAIDVSARDGADLHFELTGPEGYRREGPGAPRLLVARDEAPAGPYLLTLTSPVPPAARRVTAQARWDLGRGHGLPAQTDPLLEPGQPLTFVMGGKDPDVRGLRIEVPRGTAGFSLEAEASGSADVDVYVRRGKPIEEGIEDAEWLGLTSGPREHLRVGGVELLPPGTYFAWAVLVEDDRSEEVTLTLERLASERTADPAARALPAESAPTLPEGIWIAGTVRPAISGITWHAIELPRGAGSVHGRLIEATAPLDLVLARPSDGAILARSLSTRVDEPLAYDFERPLDRPRRFLVGVLSRESAETLVHYRLAVSPGEAPDPPPDLAWPPLLKPEGLTALERAASATVELTTEEGGGGSGTCITPRGLLLSCRHVLETGGEGGTARLQRTGILVAFVERLDAPPTQSYVARVVAEDEELDLALLKIVADVFGRPLPKDLALPWLALGDSTALRLGDPLVALGFPEGGSTRSRTAIVVSKGLVSGLERAPGQPEWIKTDAWIAPGHSGGALVNTEGRLVAVPLATLGVGERLGLALPIALLPADWKSMVESGLR